MDRFTHFPSSDADAAPPVVLAWQIDAPDLPSDVYALSWAALLSASTADETPVFLLNGAPVKADLSARTIHTATLDAIADLSQKNTSVVIQDNLSAEENGQPPVSGVLTWTFDPATQWGALHSTGHIDATFMHELGKQLKQMVQDQAARLGMQVKLPASELPALSISNPSPCTLPGPQLLHELALSGSNGSHNAIEFLAADGNIHCLSYHALDQLSTKLGTEIALASAAQNDVRKSVVPVLLPQSVELYISWLAILKSGAAFCPLNLDAPPDRIEFILQDVAASVVVTQNALTGKVPQNEHLTMITVDGLERKEFDPAKPCRKECSPSDLAYVMYTSGSTGHPKGVGISHRAVTQSLLTQNDLIPPFKRFLQFASPTFDVSVFEVFFPLMRGATLIGSEREHMLLDISHVMTKMKVDAAELTPTVAGELLHTRSAAPSLQVLLTIGEMLTRYVVDEFGGSSRSTGILHGMYGPTESAIHCTAATQFHAQSRVNLIGKPFKTVSAYIMSLEAEDGSSDIEPQPIPLGQIGELVVGGPQLADGYINRPEENAKAFIESPRYGRLYRTGDKARMLPTGAIECFGRISSGQVKLRGQRIELGEIEHVICLAPEVRSAVAIVSSGSLFAFVLVSDKGITDDSLRDICRQWLPRFMIPGEFVLVNQFPQLPSGKIDRKALEADFARHRAAAQVVGEQPFRDIVEETIISTVAEVLGRRPSPTQSLVTAGLDSLAAIHLASHLLDAGIRLDVGTLLEAESVDRICQFAKDLQASQPTEDTQANLSRIRQLVLEAGTARLEALGLRSQVTEVEPCSHIQQAMILETIRNQKAYCNWIELEFNSSVSGTSARDAFIKLSQQNDILRSGFVEIGLKDHLYGRFTWRALDERLFQRCDELVYDVSLNADHDLLQPFRVQFMEVQEGLRVLIHIHHALYDGWSWELILKDLHNILLGEELVHRPGYDIVTNFFIEYKMCESAMDSSLFWRDQLQGSSPVPFPNFHGKTDAVPGTEQATRLLDISISQLNEVARALRISRQTIFQAAFCYILASYQGTGDVIYGTVFSGRTLPIKGIETVLGPCIRTIPIRMDLDQMQDITDLLLAIQNMNRNSLEHGSLPLQDVKKTSGIDMSRNLFDCALAWQESIWPDKLQGAFFHEVGAAEFLEFALLLELEPRDDGVRAKATYQRSIIPHEQVKILLEQIDCVASVLINSPNMPIHEVCNCLPQSVLSVHSAVEAQSNLSNLASGVKNNTSLDPSKTAVELMLANDVASVALAKNTSAMIAADREVFCLLPRGAAGEICFSGDEVVRGIADLGDSARGRFINHPSFGRIYRTGNFGRLLPDGSLILIERPDRARLYGQQIDLIEVDRAHPEDSLTDQEKTIAAALSAVTGADQHHMHRNTSFHSVGLDSLSAISFSRKLQESGCGRLPVSAILRHNSVAQLAAVLPAMAGAHQYPHSSSQDSATVFDDSFISQVEDEIKLSGASVRSIYPCTPLQEAMLAAEPSGGHSAYFNHLLLRVNTDAGALKAAWDQMLQKHDILRTCFKSTNDKRFAYAQVVVDRASLSWSHVETSSDALDRDIDKKKASVESRSPVNGELPYTLTLLKDSAMAQTHLLLSIHHALYDGEGIAQLLHEVQVFLSGEELPRVTPFHRFIDYMLSVNSEASDAYWDRYLSGVLPTLLSTPEETKRGTTSQQTHAQLKIPLDSFKQHCKDLSVAPLNVFHAAWARLISLYAGSAEVCFGNVFSCRTVPLDGADSIVGPCFNTLPMCIRFSSTATNGDIMKLAQKNNSDILPHQLSPLRRVQQRVLGDGSRLFDTLVILQNQNMELDSAIWELLRDEGNMGFPLVCEIVPDSTYNAIRVCLHFQRSRIAPVSAEKVSQDFLALVEQTIRYPSAQASDRRCVAADIPLLFEQREPQSTTSVKFAITKPRTSRPWTHQEEAVRDILCKFSDCDSDAVWPETTIFQLGLDSINAVQISAILRKLDYKVSAGDLLEAASIDKIASFLSSSEKTDKEESFDFSDFESQYLHSTCEQLHISPKTVQSLRPCTPVQNGMLALFTRSRGDMYFNRMAVKFSMPLNKRLFKQAWYTVMTQHEMLRTGFVQLRNQQCPFAMITYHGDIELPWYEMSDSNTNVSGVQKEDVLENLHRPPWSISVTASETVITMYFSALHALYDGQSLASIFADVTAAYKGENLTMPAPLTETLGPILVESGRNTQSAQSFWESLAPEMHSCKFPDLHPVRTEKRQLLGTSIRCSQPRRTLENACRELGVTLQAAGQATWARVLAAYTGEPNTVFGTVLSGRNLSASAQDAVFPCLVTVPSPLRIEGTNREIMDRALKRNAALVKNQFTSLSQIQHWLGSDEPVFDTLFVYQKFSTTTEDLEGWEIVDEETNIDYPVSIELIPHSTDLEVRVNYRSDVVPEEQAIIVLNQYDKLLEHTLFSPDASCEDYSCVGNSLLSVTPAKEEAILSPVSLLHQFVEVNAQKTPQKTAFEFAFSDSADNLQKKTWTYRELNENGNRIARILQAKGAAPGAMIAICFDKCPEASMAILGILKSGCAYVAIDPSAPVSRKQFILDDSGSKLLLCNLEKKAEMESLAEVDVQALDEPGLLEGIPLEQPLLSRAIEPDDTCYCLYTSGTTGSPKGCEITHGNTVQAMMAFQRLFAGHWGDESRWLQFASFHFDVSVLEQYWSWSVGICVTSCPRDILFEDLPGTINKLQITHIDLTPSLARLVHPDEVPSLCRGVFITGGEQLKQEILDEWGEHAVLYNGYGPTEATIGCTMLPRMSARNKTSNIGPQFDNVGSYVFRPATSTPVLRGSIGELCVSGPLVGKGYLNREELTQERFQVLPEYEDRIYRTGDLVRILCDGSFQFLGRIDDQVKLRGQRLEVGEINEVVKQSTSEVNEVATLVIKHPKQAKEQLVSFVTRDSAGTKSRHVEVCFWVDEKILLPTIKAACHTHLPGYMVPTHIIPMTRFPLSANNKADMKILKSIYQDLSLDDIQRLTSMSANRATDTPQEQKIISALTDFIGPSCGTISSWSSIYELGLDSISIISFSRYLKEAGFAQAQPSLIMKYPTIAGMASALRTTATSSISRENLYKNAKLGIEAFAHKHLHSVMENIGILDSDIEQIAPCTPLQEGIIYQFLSSSTPLYCSSFTFELEASFNLEKLKMAWIQAQSKVQVFRARFSPTTDGYAQVILKRDVLPWFLETVTSEENIEHTQKQKFEQWIAGLCGLSTSLWEVGVINSPTKSVMCLNIFHALYDGISLVLLLDLVAQYYLGHSKAVETPDFLDVLHLGPLYKDPSAESFWKDHLAGYQNRSLGCPLGTSIIQKIQIDTTEHVDHLRKSLNITEQAVLHACWLLTLQQHYSFVPPLGIVVSGRTIDVPGIRDVVGPLLNTIPSNIQVQDLKNWSDVAQRCHDYHVSTIPFQHTSLRDIMKWLGKNPDDRLFDTLFVFQRENARDESPTKGIWLALDSETQHEYPVAFEIVRTRNMYLTATLAAKSHVLSSEAAQQILTTFAQLLSEFAQNPSKELPQMNGALPNRHRSVNGELPRPQNPERASKQGDASEFRWTPQALTTRDVIADLAGLKQESVGKETSIFEVGLDSIDAVKLSSRLNKLGLKLPVSAIMRHRTVRGMTEHLAMSIQPDQNGTHPLLDQMEESLKKFLESEEAVPSDAGRILPATPIQEAMIAEMIASGYKHYYNHEVLQLEPLVDAAKLQGAWRAVVRAHPILRTSFVEVWDPEIPVSYAQVVHSEDHFDFQTVHLHGASVDTIIEKQRSRATTDLAHRPLVTLTAAVDDNIRYLVLSIAHALYDGWSINLLHEDVAKCYAGESCERPRPDPILEQIIASSGDRALRFWRATLSNFTWVPFPPREHASSGSDVVHRAEGPLFPLDKSETFCRQHGITMQALFVSCWSLVLATYVKRLDVVFGLVLSGRNVPESEHIMFPTMNTVAMRVILHGTRLELVKYVQEVLLEVSEHQHFPLRQARPDIGSRQVFDTIFIYQKRPLENTNARPGLYKSIGSASDVEYPVCAEIEGLPKQDKKSAVPTLVGRVACRETVMGEEDTLALLSQMAHVLRSIIDEPAQQSVDFIQNGMSICGSPIVQETPVQDAEVKSLPETSTQAQWSTIESKIRNVLSAVSGVPENSIHKNDTVFQLGLDSISAIKVTALLKKQFVKLAVSDMLKAGTIERMAQVANNHRAELPSAKLPSAQRSDALRESLNGINVDELLRIYDIDPRRVQKIFPATAGQSYFLSVHALNPDVFYPEFCYLASKELSEELLNEAWARLIELTPILRTAFIPIGNPQVPYLQIVLESMCNPVVWHRSNGAKISSQTRRGFGSVPVALHAWNTAGGTSLMLQIHHALYDAVSLPYMLNRLSRLCNQTETSNTPSDLVDLSDLVAFQQVHLPVEVRRQFWQNYLGQASINEPAAVHTGEFRAIQHCYRPGLVHNMSILERAAKRHGLSVPAIFLALYARVHAQYVTATNGIDEGIRPQLIVGLYLANRSHAVERQSELVAPTINIVPLRLDDKMSDSDESLFAAAQKVQDEIREISRIEHVSVSLIEIAEWTGVRINTCINFLRLPELDESSTHAHEQQDFSFKAVQRTELERLRVSSDCTYDHPEEIETPSVPVPDIDSTSSLAGIQNVFQPTIDVEVAIRDDQLDFGLFAPSSRLSCNQAHRIMEHVQQEMHTLVEAQRELP